MSLRRAITTALAATVGSVVLAAALVATAVAISPWPSALIIRRAFDKGGRERNASLAHLVPDGVVSTTAVRFDSVDATDADALLDVHRPAAPGRYPTIVWVHGGGWVSGSRTQVASYLKILAGEGFVVAAVDYSLAPGARYPRPVHQVLAAVDFLVSHAAELDLDADRVVLGGDSAGSQIAAQVATAVSDPAYASALGVAPSLPRSSLRATVLHCGAYDLDMRDSPTRAGTWFIESVLWSYTGSRDVGANPLLDLASVRKHVDASFPPSYVSGGDADPLTPQGRAFAARLAELGVDLETDFPEPGTDPSGPLNHEFQFALETDAGRRTFERSVAFLRARTAPSVDDASSTGRNAAGG